MDNIKGKENFMKGLKMSTDNALFESEQQKISEKNKGFDYEKLAAEVVKQMKPLMPKMIKEVIKNMDIGGMEDQQVGLIIENNLFKGKLEHVRKLK